MPKTNFTTPEEVRDLVSKGVDGLNKTMGAVVLVMFVGFVALLITVIAMVLDVFQSRTDATNDLRDSVDDLNSNIRLFVPSHELNLNDKK